MADHHPINIGDKFGRLTVVSVQPGDRTRRRRFLCQCICGNSTLVLPFHLAQGRTRSCGCLMVQNRTKGTKFSHGESVPAIRTTEYSIWLGIRARCNNPKEPAYKWYGAKGVRVCARWDRFEHFLADMGRRPENLSLDRINPFGNYEPGNCRWATAMEQRHNRRDSEQWASTPSPAKPTK